jgi:hypothetical protein
MHDINGAELKVNDVVMIPCRITALSPGDDFCNVSLETLYGRRPDGMKETMYAINTGVTVLMERAKNG